LWQEVGRRQLHVAQGSFEAGSLVATGREDHDRPLVEDDLELEPKVAHSLEHRRLVRLPCRRNRPSDRDRGDAALLQQLDERNRRRCRDRALLVGRRIIDQRAIFRDDAVENCDLREDALKVGQLTAGD
jgi:hypothetical protein